MRRNKEKDLSEWFSKKNRKPLIIRGARQVGKSTLVRQFAKNNNLELIEVNLEIYPQLEIIFQKNNPLTVIDEISAIFRKEIKIHKNLLLFLDEIQATPSAIACLRYFYETTPELAVICAGSLIEFTLNDHSYSMPVGRIEFLYLGPMTFEEFLEAKNEIYLLNQIKNITQFDLITNELHQLGLALLREYLFIGGMPEAIQTSLDLGIHEVEKVHHQILATYSADFIKYTKKSHLLKIQKVFQYLYTNNLKKIKYTNISREDHSKDISQNLKLLFMAQIAYPVTHSNCNGIPLLAGEKEKVFKNLVLDVGLLSSINRTFWPTFKNTTDDKLMTEGVMAEQFVGQHLLFSADSFREPKLNYWLREGKSDNAEIDFVLEYQNFLVAFEVKSGAAGKLRSLHQWASTTTSSNKKMIRFNTTKGALETINHMDYKYELLTLPLYMVQQWSRLLLFHSKNKLNLDLGRENE